MSLERSSQSFDCLIIGAGPAGLLAAIYLARFRRKVLVVEAQSSRAVLIPTSHNIPGFAGGVSGNELIHHLRRQVSELNVVVQIGNVVRLEKRAQRFNAILENGTNIFAAKVIMATGIVDLHPNVPGWKEAQDRGVLRYCPICDGYEAIDKAIAVIGSTESAVKKAIFLRAFSSQVTIIGHEISGHEGSMPKVDAIDNIKVISSRLKRLQEHGTGVVAILADGGSLPFDVVYPALGADVRSELAIALGAAHTHSGFLTVSDKQQTSVDGLYAIGDVVSDLHQVAVGFGHAAVAACHIHNALPKVFA